eukprot:5417433-Pyramimonas_sp.AAC.1
MLSYYNTAERLDYLPISNRTSTMTLGMNTKKKIFRISSDVEKLPYVKTTFDGFYSREQPVGTWVDQAPPWTTLATCKGTCKVNMDQCTTGLRDSHGVLIRKPTEITANHRLLITLFERKRCVGHHQNAS